MKIYKFNLEMLKLQTLSLPEGQILKIAAVENGMSMWVEFDETKDIEHKMEFLLVGTGDSFDSECFTYIDTVFHGDFFVWHIYYRDKG
jgi:hypothetical protein